MSWSGDLRKVSEIILVIAKSARMLTRYLVDLGYKVVAIDCFGDCDTRDLASDFRRVENLSTAQVGQALADLKARHELTAVVYGSGLESEIDTLYRLQAELPVWGNSPGCFDAVQGKPAFFRRLDYLHIDHPPVVFTPPRDRHSSWLQKPLRGEGGLGIRRLDGAGVVDAQGVYWQRYQQGEALSALFVAARDRVEIIGYQQQLLAGDGEQAFLFAGVMSKPDFPSALREQVEQWALALSCSFRLRGLNSLDFIYKDGRCYVLEINARPSASLQLYGPEALAKHIQAVVTGAFERGEADKAWAAYQIIYASRETVIGASGLWPDWIVDRPAFGSVIGPGEPVCSIIARASSRRQLLESLRHKRLHIEKLLAKGI